MASLFRLRILSLTRSYFSTSRPPVPKPPSIPREKARAALSLLQSEKNPERIVEICREASLSPEYHLDRIAFSMAITKLSESNNFSHIQQFLDELRRTRPDLRTERFASHAMILFGQANMVDDAIRTFKEYYDEVSKIGDFSGSGSVKSLNALLYACVLAKNYGEVKRIFEEFPRTYNILPDLETYNTVISALTKSGASSFCYSVIHEMCAKGVKPSSTTFGHLITGFYRENKYKDVENVLKMMEEFGISAWLSTYNIRIQSLCVLKKPQEAKVLFEEMLSKGVKPNSVTYSHLILGFCKEGDLEEAKRLFNSMANQPCERDSECYFILAYYLCQGGDFETALSVCKESIGKGWVPKFSTMKSLVNGLASVGQVEEAKEIIRHMKVKMAKNVHLWEEVEAGLAR